MIINIALGKHTINKLCLMFQRVRVSTDYDTKWPSLHYTKLIIIVGYCNVLI